MEEMNTSEIPLTQKIELYLKQYAEQYGNTVFFTQDMAHEQVAEEQAIETESMASKKQATQQSTSHIFTPPEYTSVDMFQERPAWIDATELTVLQKEICTCTKCDLGNTRKNFVFGVGNPNAEIVIIGEAPGADEDEQGEPFVGRAGQLLTKILEAIGLTREEVFICNILKCRPPNNRTPFPSETELCEPYLYKQLDLIQPKFILAVGLTAANTLLKQTNKMGEIRGKFMNYYGARMIVTYHPAALLRNPNWKVHTWEDVKMLRAAYDEYLNKGILPEV